MQPEENRVCPGLCAGGAFDPLGLASEPTRAAKLREAEIKHGRLAMIAFLGRLTYLFCFFCHCIGLRFASTNRVFLVLLAGFGVQAFYQVWACH